MTTSQDPDEIRAEIERTRASLSSNVDELAESARPVNVAKRQVDKVKDAAGGLKEKLMGSDDTYSGPTLADRTSGAADALADRATSAKYAVTDTAANARDTVADTAANARDAVAGAPAAAKQKTQGNPLAAGVIAFGVGLLVSSLIPSSQKEQQAVSQLQDKAEPLKEQATALAQEVAGNLREPAQEAAASVKATAVEGVENVKSEGTSAAEDVKQQAADSKEAVQETR